MIAHHHNPASTYNKERATKPGENGLKWLKMGENGWQLKCAKSSMHKKRKNPVMEQQTCEKGPKLGFKELQTYKSLHCVRTAWARRAHCMHGIPLQCRERFLRMYSTTMW